MAGRKLNCTTEFANGMKPSARAATAQDPQERTPGFLPRRPWLRALILGGVASFISFFATIGAFVILSFGGYATVGWQIRLMENVDPGKPGIAVAFVVFAILVIVSTLSIATWKAPPSWRILVVTLTVGSILLASAIGMFLIQTDLYVP